MKFLFTPINLLASNNSDAVVPETDKLSMEGKIVQKLECRPHGKTLYLNNHFNFTYQL